MILSTKNLKTLAPQHNPKIAIITQKLRLGTQMNNLAKGVALGVWDLSQHQATNGFAARSAI